MHNWFRVDMLWSMPIVRPAAIVRSELGAFGIEVRESEHAERPAFRVIKSHPRARRKRYTVQRYMQPCAFVVGGVWFVHPSIATALRSTLDTEARQA